MTSEFKRFNDLTEEDLKTDFHMHTDWTDGKDSPKDMLSAAQKKGLKKINFSEHVNSTTDWFDKFSATIEHIKREAKIKVYLGAEVKAIDLDGNLDLAPQIQDKLDLITGVCHRYPLGDGKFMSIKEISKLDPEVAMKMEFDTLMGLLDNPDIDILGHPFGIYSCHHEIFPEDMLRQVLMKAKEKGVAVEINTRYIKEWDRTIGLFKEINPLVSFGSNAHSTSEIAKDFRRIL